MWLFNLGRNDLYEPKNDEDNSIEPVAVEAADPTEEEKMEFNMQRIGRNIASYRKAHNMTQMNLADQMNISYQAVSNWERGQTMPDISKLPELALILGCSVDDLLGDGRAAEIVNHLVEDTDISSPITAEELTTVAPALEPKQTRRIIEEQAEHQWSIHELFPLAPFIDSDLLSDYTLKAVQNGADISDITGLAPFLDSHALGKIIQIHVDNGGQINNLSSLAPFLSGEQLGQIVHQQLLSGASLQNLTSFVPFLSNKDLDKVLEMHLANGGKIDNIISLAPFLNQSTLRKIVRNAIENGDDIGNIAALGPFLDRETMQLIFEAKFK